MKIKLKRKKQVDAYYNIDEELIDIFLLYLNNFNQPTMLTLNIC